MTYSCRVYIYMVSKDGTKEFLHTTLDKKSAKNYCKDHAKLFRNQYIYYTYGSMNTEMNDWEIYKED